jgi:hypothetical protein
MDAKRHSSLALYVVAFLATLLTCPAAIARIVANTIDGSAILTEGGRHLVVTGPISCTLGERAFLRITVTQRETATLAEGNTLITCAGALQQWEVYVATQGREAFRPGAATVVASARTTQHGEDTDAHQWPTVIFLVQE